MSWKVRAIRENAWWERFSAADQDGRRAMLAEKGRQDGYDLLVRVRGRAEADEWLRKMEDQPEPTDLDALDS